MKLSIIISIFVLLTTNSFSQPSKHTLSLGLGVENAFNEMVLPYNFSGISFNIDYDFEKKLKESWKVFADADVHISSQFLDHNFSEQRRYKVNLNSYHVNIDLIFLRKIIEKGYFSLYAGLISSLQGTYQYNNYSTIYSTSYNTPLPNSFTNTSLAKGVSISFQLQFKKLLIQNTTNYLLLTASLYPNYSGNSFVDGNNISHYFVLSSINERNYLANKFKIEFPLYIKGRLFSSFAFSYNMKYEYSTIKDNKYKRFSNIFGLGVIFKLSKLDIIKTNNY